jgi:tetratricopeptide (TPR) repeat protein
MSIYVLLLVLAGSPQVTQQDPSRVGWEAIQRGDGEKAASAFRQVLAANPRDVRALTGAGIAAHLLGRDDEAVTSLKRAVQADPDNVQASFLLGQVAYSQGDIDLAIKSYERVVKISPGDPGIYRQLQDWKKEAALHETFAARPAARFTVMFEGPAQQAIADRVSSILDAAYSRVGRTLNTYPSEPVTAILYTRQQFRDITKSPSWAAAAYDGRIRIPVMGALTNVTELDRLRAADGMIPLARLDAAFATPDGGEALLAYAESYVGARVLAERLGANFPVFLQYVSNGTSIEQALLLFNISAGDVEREWTRRSRARQQPDS